jgi:glycosyltransferase involved in cell wall biosynthesis
VKGERIEKKGALNIRRVQWFGCGFLHKLRGYPLLQIVYLGPPLFLCSLFFILRNYNKIDVIHSHGLTAALVTKILAKILKVRNRCVCSLHYTYNFDSEPFMRKASLLILSHFDIVLTLSEKSRQDLLRLGFSNNKVKVYRHWVDLNFFRPLSNNFKKDLKNLDVNNKFIVLFVGRLLPSKGVLQLIDAITLLCYKNYKIACLIVGEGPLANTVRHIESVNNNIKFIGKVSREVLVKLYNVADIVVVPSQSEGEEGQRVVIEALSCGKPVIASNKGSLRELLNEKVGILTEPTAIDIANAIDELYINRNKLKYLKSNARKYAYTQFSEKNAEIIEKSYFS